MRVRINPSKARGTISAPPSKSMAHRALICAALASGESVVRRLAMSEDILATIDCLTALGAHITLKDGTAFIKGVGDRLDALADKPLFCRESGSTLRFLIPLCLFDGRRRTLYGSDRLFERGLTVYEEICRRQGIIFDRHGASLTVEGRLRSGDYEIPGFISSQFVSGLLFLLPLLEGDSRIRLIAPVESRPYIEMTMDTMRRFGVAAQMKEQSIVLKGHQHYSSKELTVEGDCSNAAFFEALNYASGAVTVEGIGADTLQGDRIYKILFEKIKAGETPINIADCPDLAPVLFVTAALCGGGEFTGTKRLRIKESDRAAAMQEELSKFGATVEVLDDIVRVYPSKLHTPIVPLSGHNDHRVVMALSVLCTRYGGVIEGAEAVKKSFPDFFECLKSLHTEVITDDGMDQ